MGDINVNAVPWYVVRSRACMPATCWGRYQHVAIVCRLDWGVPRVIRNTRHARVVMRTSRLYWGTTDRCAAESVARDYQQICDEHNALLGAP